MQRQLNTIDQFVEDFEVAALEDPTIDVADFLPVESHPQFHMIAVELLRVDLEYRFRSDSDVDLDEYLRRFPMVFVSESEVHDLAFEHYRLRRVAKDSGDPDEYAARYKIDTSNWQRDVSTLQPRQTNVERSTIDAEIALQQLEAGQDFESFVLKDELGRGALARVFLATQTGVADRDVVLKFQPEQTAEVSRLGRLQHPNIVPIHSVHVFHRGSAICMPFLGRRTLRDLIGASNKEITAIGVGIDLARALCHAHEHGVLHRDIKPANILITDDNRAMLLDFNLAEDMAGDDQQVVGGTPAYMAPEQFAALMDRTAGSSSDRRSDIYSIGAVLHEFITGRTFDKSLESLREQCSPAMFAVLAKCLVENPDERYQYANELLEDLERHSQNQPLKHQRETDSRERFTKWVKRHPRLSSATMLCIMFGGVAAGVGYAWSARTERLEHLTLIENCRHFESEVTEIRALLALNDPESESAAEGLQRGQELLAEVASNDGYFVSAHLSADEKRNYSTAIGELLFYMSQANRRLSVAGTPKEREQRSQQSRTYNAQATEWFADQLGFVPRALLVQRARIDGTSEPVGAASTLTALDKLLLAIELNQQRRFDESIRYLDSVKTEFSHDVAFWNVLGSAYAGEDQFAQAEVCFTTCISIKPDSWIAWCNRGLSRMSAANTRGAEADFSEVINLRGDHWSGYLNRAIARGRLRKFRAAIQDLLKGESQGGPTRIRFLRARYRAAIGDTEGAKADRLAGLSATPTDVKSWLSRGVAQVEANPKAALADFREAVRMQPSSVEGWRNIAHVLSEKLNRPADAINALTRPIDAKTDDPATYAGRAVLFARQDQKHEAIADINESLRLSQHSRNLYQAACVHALLVKYGKAHQSRAMSLLAKAFAADPSLINLAKTDRDLASLIETTEYHELVDAITTVRRMGLESSKPNEP